MSAHPRIVLIAASDRIVGGHSVQASALQEHWRADGVPVERMAIDRPLPHGLQWSRRVPVWRTLVNQMLFWWALRRVRGAGVVHVFSASYWSFLLAPVPAMVAGRLAGARVILHYHSGEVVDHLAHWGWLVHPWLRLADEIVVCSGFQQRAFASFGHRTRVIANVVDLRAFTYVPRRPLRPRFICTRNFEAHYGIDIVIEAFARIQVRWPEATLCLAGTGRLAPMLQRAANRPGLGGIFFTGAVPRDAMPAVLADADIYLNASTTDNQPVSLLEACASGLPIVSTPTGGISEMLGDRTSGVLVPAGDPVAMADAACRLLEAPELAGRIAAEARHSVERFTWTRIRPAWVDVYRLGDSAASLLGDLAVDERGLS